MRITNKEKNIILDTIKDIFGDSEVYLFGSRIDDTKRGGDIDIFIIPKNKTNLLYKKLLTKSRLENILFKPFDIIVSKNNNSLIEKEALEGIKLC
jgi:predicted nucleotidyltransferase